MIQQADLTHSIGKRGQIYLISRSQQTLSASTAEQWHARRRASLLRILELIQFFRSCKVGCQLHGGQVMPVDQEYREQEVPEEEGVPEERYELPSEEMPSDEPEIPQEGY